MSQVLSQSIIKLVILCWPGDKQGRFLQAAARVQGLPFCQVSHKVCPVDDAILDKTSADLDQGVVIDPGTIVPLNGRDCPWSKKSQA